MVIDTGPDGSVAVVFIGSGERPWVDPATIELIPSISFRRINGDSLLRELALAKTALQQGDQFFSYGASLTEFAAYQFRPVIKFLSAWHERKSKGILIADEVGLGKTIEAAIIMQELKARSNASRILVVCPSKLTAKWKEEMLARFNEDFSVWSANNVREQMGLADRVGETLRFQAIVSLEMIRRREFLALLDHPAFQIDYLIIDESHHMRNPGTANFKIGTLLSEKAKAVVLLSATPVHLANENLQTLLRLLAPQVYGDSLQFQLQMKPNASINRAVREIANGNRRKAARSLRQVYGTELGHRFRSDPGYQSLIADISASRAPLTPAETVDYKRRIASFNTLSSIVNRTRKREFQNVAQREAFSVEVQLSQTERALYDATLAHVQRELASNHGRTVGFAMVMRERQAASCLPAMRPYLKKLDQKQENDLFESSEFDLDIPPMDASPQDTLPLWKDDRSGKHLSLIELLAMSGSLEKDSKFEHLIHEVKKVLSEGEGRKILLFAYFRDTLEYLDRQLQRHGIKSEFIHGGVPVQRRQEKLRDFRETQKIQILLSSEVGSEGLDFEFCDVLINYDLPWNPMAIEQRIGRLDRFNRDKHKKIRIINFFLKDTIETRIFKKLYERINIFKHSIGDLEDILGEVVSNINKDMLLPDLTDAQRERRAESELERIANTERENEEFAKQEQKLLGQTDILDSQIHDTIRSGRTISGEEVRAMVSEMVSCQYGESVFQLDDGDGSAYIRFNHDFSKHFDDFVVESGKRLPRSSQLRSALIERRLCPLVFDRKQAMSRPNAEFVTMHHPLGQMALAYWRDRAHSGNSSIPMTSIQLPGNAGESDAWFFIYRVRVRSIQDRQLLEVVVLRESDITVMEAVESTLLSEIQKETYKRRSTNSLDDATLQHWLELGRHEMESRRKVLATREQEDFDIRLKASISTLTASRDTEIAYLRKRMNEVDDARIKTMRRSEIKRKTGEYDERIHQLLETREVMVEYECIAGGKLSFGVED